MKQLIFLFALLTTTFTLQAQEGLKLGFHAGIPVSDTDEVSNFFAGIDGSYLFSVAESFYVGPTTGYSNFFGKTITSGTIELEVEDFGLVPIALTGVYTQGDESFIAGGDFGYGFLTNTTGSDGGFYYNPFIGYDFGGAEGTIGYEGLSVDGATFAGVYLGIAFSPGN